MYTWFMRVARDSRRFLGLSALACLICIAPAHADSNGILRVAFADQRGFPAANISVTLYSPDRVRQAKTDRTGKVEFTALPFQIYELEALSVSFADVRLSNIQITSNDPITLNIPLKLWSPPHELWCPPPLAIDAVPGLDRQAAYEERTNKVNLTGIISFLPARSQPLKGATITLAKFETPEIPVSQATADNNGIYEFTDVEPGQYSLTVSYNGILEKPDDFHFWVTRENLTRLGQIEYGLSQMNDICGGDRVTTIVPESDPISTPPPELAIPFPLPLPPRPKSATSRKN
jgi:hypothetical protein